MLSKTKPKNKPKQTYVKKDPISHILDRPDMYVGSIRSREIDEFVVEKDCQIVRKTINVSPAIVRMFVEPLSNIVDNVARSKQNKNPTSKIAVNIDEDNGTVSMWNDGDIIPIEIHTDEKCYNHTLIFGQLLTGSNYDDENDEREDISGKNGLGIKVVSVYSKEFIVEGVDPVNKKQFKQVWTDNMRTVSEPVIRASKLKKGYTKISFTLDFARFGLEKFTADIISLYKRFIFDTAMITKVPVYLNDQEIPVKSLTDYAKLYLLDEHKDKDLIAVKTAECEVVLAPNPNVEFQTISFANGIYTPLGGTHVDAWAEAFFRPILDKLNEPKKPQLNITDVKKFFYLFIVATVKKPEYDSQSKTKLESPVIKAEIKPTQIKKILTWSVIEDIRDIIRFKEMAVLKKVERKKRGHEHVDGLDCANNEGGTKGHECILILVEGLSAKTYAVDALQKGVFGKVGRDWIGIYSLKGKIRNCRKATPLSISKNKVITDIIKALGVQYGVDYTDETNYRKLRYGRVLILTDADSVSADTPLLVKNKLGQIQIKTIDDISSNWTGKEKGKEKEYSNTEFDVWTEKGWSKINTVMRHKVFKRMFRIVTHTGAVDVTEDHSLITYRGDEISPKECDLTTELLHSFPLFFEPVADFKSSVSDSEAFVMGLFFVDGSCGTDYWIISNNNLELLNKSKNIMVQQYPDYKFIVQENKLILKGENTKDFIEQYRRLFYNKDKNKQIPPIILNGTRSIRQNFYNGLYDGDSGKDLIMTITNKFTTQCVYLLGKSLGYNVSINCGVDKPNVFVVILDKSQYRFSPSSKRKIKKIIDLGVSEQYVYDLETENHHFQAGVGELIVHNTDGIHISGLIQNMFHCLFPSLLDRVEPFIVSAQTPIVRVFTGKKSSILFYDEEEYKQYVIDNTEQKGKRINKQYYKGLGSSNTADVIETFGQKIVRFTSDSKTSETMNKAFHTKFADVRKNWLETYDPSKTILKWHGNDKEEIDISLSDFIDTELIKFSINDCKRSIPNIMDGLKEGHRKVLFYCLKNNIKKLIKVAQLAGKVSADTNYHHGEDSLNKTIIGMASFYVGSNNIPYLYRGGQCGTRIHGGEDAAHGRYVWTRMENLTRLIFRAEDDPLLTYIEDDGDKIEPEFYVPIIPMILVNGSIGIGTGWSCNIPCYNPLELVNAVKVWLENDGNVLIKNNDMIISQLPELKPWYYGYTGEITTEESGQFTSWGKVEPGNDSDKAKVVELPVGMWTADFQNALEKLVESKEIDSFTINYTPTVVDFTITETEAGIKCNNETLKLHKFIKTTNMVLFSEKSLLRKFTTIDEIIDSFCSVRYSYYGKRKEYLLKIFGGKIKLLGNKKRFLEEIRDGVLKLFEEQKGKRQSRKTADIVAELEKNGYDKEIDEEEEDKEEENEEKKKSTGHGYEYLLRLQISSITIEKIENLQKEIDSYTEQYKELETTTTRQMWEKDLDTFVDGYNKWLRELADENRDLENLLKKVHQSDSGKPKQRRKKKE